MLEHGRVRCLVDRRAVGRVAGCFFKVKFWEFRRLPAPCVRLRTRMCTHVRVRVRLRTRMCASVRVRVCVDHIPMTCIVRGPYLSAILPDTRPERCS